MRTDPTFFGGLNLSIKTFLVGPDFFSVDKMGWLWRLPLGNYSHCYLLVPFAYGCLGLCGLYHGFGVKLAILKKGGRQSP
jgi:hypothetical protein